MKHRHTFAVVAIGFALSGPSWAQLERPATAPAGDGLVWSNRYRVHGMDHPVRLVQRPGGGWYLVGWSGWKTDEKPRGWKESWWALELDEAGRQHRLFEFIGRNNLTQVWDAGWHDGGLVVVGGSFPSWLARVNGDGELMSKTDLRDGGDVASVRVLTTSKDGNLLVAGSIKPKGKPDSNAWLAKVTAAGQMIWTRHFDRGHDETVMAMAALSDGGCTLGINSGKYGKFGEGPSALWVIRCDANGERKADTAIEYARIMPAGHRYMAECFGGIAVSYTISDFPGIRATTGLAGFDTSLTLFNPDLKPRWQKRYDPAFFGSGLIAADAYGHLLVVSGLSDQMVLALLDAEGDGWSRQTIALDHGPIVADCSLQADGIVIMGREYGRPTSWPAATQPGGRTSVGIGPVVMKFQP